MYYKIEKSSAPKLFKAMGKLRANLQHCHNLALDEVEKLGGQGYVSSEGFKVLGGGVDAIHFPEGKPVGFKNYDKDRNIYMPTVKNKQVKERLAKLPVVLNSELNDILNYKEQTYKGTNVFSFHPSFCQRGDIFLISVDERAEYTPVEGMVEITVSEYKRLKDEE